MTLQTPLTTIQDEGYIKSMKLPAGWQDLSAPRPQFSAPYWRTFSPPGKPKVALSFFDRGRPISNSSQLYLQQLLSKGPAALTQNDLKSIPDVLRDAALVDEFNFLIARTEIMNGKPIIFLEGRWNELQEDCLWLITASPDCNWVCEIIYQAPKVEYPLYLKQVRECLKTIEWK